ncbi:MAG TPA: bifunctional DNA primase/polymerase [Oculatellaceae cyanobacterium]|jgi:hypothetical protein
MLKPQIKLLKQALRELPSFWQVIPVRGKRPIEKAWNQKPYTPAQLFEQLEDFNCTGIGLLTGTPIDREGNLVIAVDQDGWAASIVLNQLANGYLPPTLTFTSTKPGRCQRLYKVSPDCNLRTRCLAGGLEIRCSGLMSVLPPSVHPETQCPYQWLPQCHPLECEIALAPDWLIGLMAESEQKVDTYQRCPQPPIPNSTNCSQSHANYRKIVLGLQQLHPSRADEYHEWIRIGLALRSVGDDLLPLWDWWSQQSPKYNTGECARVWNYFKPHCITLGTLFYLAKIDSANC